MRGIHLFNSSDLLRKSETPASANMSHDYFFSSVTETFNFLTSML